MLEERTLYMGFLLLDTCSWSIDLPPAKGGFLPFATGIFYIGLLFALGSG